MKKTIKVTMFLYVLSMLVLTSCTKNKEPKSFGKIEVIDKAHILSLETKMELKQNISIPDNIFILVKTVKSINSEEIGSFASTEMEQEEWWKEVNPKSAFKRWVKQDKPWGTGIYILISKEPRLIQIRYGERIRLEAYRAGLAVGYKYSEIQNSFETTSTGLGVINSVRRLTKEVPESLEIPKYLRFMKFIIAVTFSEFEEIATPSNDIYTSWILKPYLKLIILCGGLNSKWLFLILNLILFFIIDYAVIALFAFLFLRKKKNAVKLRWKKYTSLIIATVFSVPFFGATILLSGARVEDAMAIQQLGIAIPNEMSLGLEWFMNINGFWFALLITVINFINLIITDPLKDGQILYFYGSAESAANHIREMAQGQPTFYYRYTYSQVSQHKYVIKYEEYIYRPSISLFVFLLFMPKAIGMVALLKQIFDFTVLLPSLLNSIKRSSEVS